MWNFLKHDLQFDSLIVADMRSAKSVVSTMRSVNEQEVKAWRDHPGTLFIFVYFAGQWFKPNGSMIILEDGGVLNFDQLTVPMASYSRVYVVQWVEMGLEREPEETKELLEPICDMDMYKKGLQRWFALFYNSSTDKFISYFQRLLMVDSCIVFPDEIILAGFSSAFGAGIQPDKIVLRLKGELLSNFKRTFDIWDEKPKNIV